MSASLFAVKMSGQAQHCSWRLAIAASQLAHELPAQTKSWRPSSVEWTRDTNTGYIRIQFRYECTLHIVSTPPLYLRDLDVTDWLHWSAEAVEQACNEARACIERVVQISHFWTRNRETPLSQRQRRLIEMALAPNDPEDGWLTAKRAARQTKVERVTASRDLARMEELGVIEKDPLVAGRSTRYRVRLREAKALRLVNDLTWD